MPHLGAKPGVRKRARDIAGIYAAVLTAAAAVYILIKAGLFRFVCPFNAVTGLRCPGCGNTRAVLAVLSGDFYGACLNNLMFYPEAALLIFFIVYLPYIYITGRPFSRIAKVILTAGAVTAAAWWIVRNILNI